MKVCVVGGGLMGLTVAARLAARGHKVDVLEAGPQVGGLTTWHDFGQFVWDKFYHVILPSDTHLISFLSEIGLADSLRWQTTRTGFFVDEHVYSLSTNVEYLRFPALSLWSKFRLALTILYCARIDDWRRLEKINVNDWLIKWSGRATYEKLWKPLLLAKLGETHERVSAVFIWSYIKRMFSARDGSAQKEQLGHVSGGYKKVFDAITETIESTAGRVELNTVVDRIEPGRDARLDVIVGGRAVSYDKVICTGPFNVLKRVAAEELLEHREAGAEVEYLGVVCVVLVTREPIAPFYVLNIADDRIPFTGLIGMSNVVSPSETAGLHITYLPKYVLSTDEFLKRDDESVKRMFLDGLNLMYPEFDQAMIESVHVNRAQRVQPLQVIDYSTLIPSSRTLHPNFYVLNTSQFVNNTLNNNEVIRAVGDFMMAFGDEF